MFLQERFLEKIRPKKVFQETLQTTQINMIPIGAYLLAGVPYTYLKVREVNVTGLPGVFAVLSFWAGWFLILLYNLRK